MSQQKNEIPDDLDHPYFFELRDPHGELVRFMSIGLSAHWVKLVSHRTHQRLPARPAAGRITPVRRPAQCHQAKGVASPHPMQSCVHFGTDVRNK
jgi:hypothetical protein